MHSSSNGSASHNHISEFEKMVAEESWESLARLAMTFTIEFEQESKETKKLKKEMSVVKHVLREHLTNPEYSGRFVNGTFFITLTRYIGKLEIAIDKHGSKQTDLLIFLKALLNRIKTEKISVQKPIERLDEFKKMTDVVENGHSNMFEPTKNKTNGQSP